MKDKPPLGVVPLDLHRDQRILELSMAINEYTACYSPPAKPSPSIVGWAEELLKLLKEKFNVEVKP